MSGKRLDYAGRARRDLEAIEKYHLEVAGDVAADRVDPRRVEIARVIHQRAEYFQRGR